MVKHRPPLSFIEKHINKSLALLPEVVCKFKVEYIVSHVNLHPYLFLLISVMNYVSVLLLLSLIVYQ